MLLIDWTPELAPLLYAMNGLLVLSAFAVAAQPLARSLGARLRTLIPPHAAGPALGFR